MISVKLSIIHPVLHTPHHITIHLTHHSYCPVLPGTVRYCPVVTTPVYPVRRPGPECPSLSDPVHLHVHYGLFLDLFGHFFQVCINVSINNKLCMGRSLDPLAEMLRSRGCMESVHQLIHCIGECVPRL